MVSPEWYYVLPRHACLECLAAFQVGCGSAAASVEMWGLGLCENKQPSEAMLNINVHILQMRSHRKHLHPATKHGHRFLKCDGPRGVALKLWRSILDFKYPANSYNNQLESVF